LVKIPSVDPPDRAIRLDDPEVVRRAYATEVGLRARSNLYGSSQTHGPDPRDIALDALGEMRPRMILDVGCGWGDLARTARERTGARVICLDLSLRMATLASRQSLDAIQGDVQALPLRPGAFDCALAAWMLYHVPDLHLGLAELGRVLAPGGRLIAITNGAEHLAELWKLVEAERTPMSFSRENGSSLLKEHFSSVVRHDVDGWITFQDQLAVQSYFKASIALAPLADRLALIDGPVRARRAVTVFVADRSMPRAATQATTEVVR
jgi:SAM-dependent methyltransferase